MFLSGGGDVLDPEQEAGLEGYLEAGGGFLGVHDAARAEPYSDWFTGLIGARPAANSPEKHSGPPSRSATASTRRPRTCRCEWKRPDKWLNWKENPRGSVHTVARVRENTYHPGDGLRRLGPPCLLVP